MACLRLAAPDRKTPDAVYGDGLAQDSHLLPFQVGIIIRQAAPFCKPPRPTAKKGAETLPVARWLLAQPASLGYNESRKGGFAMKMAVWVTVLNLGMLTLLATVLGYLVYLIIRALRKYLASEPRRAEQAQQAKTLGEAIRQGRVQCGMTQEFVAEALGVSRQAVSKWESGRADPSTTNLIALAKLLDVPPEDLLRSTR